ncbi:MAG TPA: helix-turn-helix domain-containing protein [Planctomycetota bacterium]|nr:helix-turn-helix domain-containing protein [Planctomycetota bacterium]
MRTPQRNHSLRHGFAALELVALAPTPPSTGDIAERLELHKSTCSRLMLTLAEDGYVERVGRGRWRAHLGLFAIGAFGLRASPLAKAAPLMGALIAATGCVVALGFVWNRQVVYLFHSNEPTVMRGFGNVYPVDESSIGRLLAAQRRRRALIEHPDGRFSLAVPVEGTTARLGLALAGAKEALTEANERLLLACAGEIERLLAAPPPG